MARLMETVDLYVGSRTDLVITNLTGHPTVVFPGSLRDITVARPRGPSPSPAACMGNRPSWPWPTPTSKPPATISSARRWTGTSRRTWPRRDEGRRPES